MRTVFQSVEEASTVLYSDSERAMSRYNWLFEQFCRYCKDDEVCYFSAPGRIEICGNHTDHQGGKVLTAAIERDAVAVAAKRNDKVIRICSRGQKAFEVNISFTAPIKNEFGKSAGMVRGIAARFIEHGVNVGGIEMCIDSDVATGSGISSSAAFETLVATAINHFYNEDEFNSVEIAKIGQFAESEYFGKPCGLMDQMASAGGGCIMIDFGNDEPIINTVNMGCLSDIIDIIIVNAGGSHVKLGKEYASIVREMHNSANVFGKSRLSEISEEVFMANLDSVRKKTGDRAALRGMHYFNETKRVERAVSALTRSDADDFLNIINESGESSALLLQNVYLDHVHDKSVALALALTKNFLRENRCKGACRIHGGGFLGTILTFIPKEFSEKYINHMENIFGKGSVYVVNIRKYGGIAVCREIKR